MEKKCVLVCVTGQKTCERLITAGSCIAKELDAETTVIHVAREGVDLLGGSLKEAEALEYLFRMASEHGAGMMVVRSNEVVPTLVSHARKLNVEMIVLGSPRKARRDITKEIRAELPEMKFEIIYTEE
jgi:K+-sensing histidine kinase KdpD